MAKGVVHDVHESPSAERSLFMATLLHLLGISGSLYEKSYNTVALHAAQQMLPEDVTMEIFAYYDTDLQR
jgi:hypothetical protein